MGQRSTRRGRPHCEAFPALDIVQAERSLRAAGGAVAWLDERGWLVGQGRLLDLNQRRAVFRYEFSGSANIMRAKAIVELEVSSTRRNPDVVRKSFLCPSCSKRTDKLFFVQASWGCRTCHNLFYLKQRLGAVNKLINARDITSLAVSELSTDTKRKRDYQNQQRRLDRINRELAAQGTPSLPQELLFRTHAKWQPFAENILEVAQISAAGAPHNDNVEPAITEGLAYYRPAPRPVLPVEACELIGSVILDQPCQPFLTRFKAEKAAEIVAGFQENGLRPLRIGWADFAALLSERINLRPIVITSDWSDIKEKVGATGRPEFSIAANYAGDLALWRASPGSKPYKRVLRAILNDTTITLCVRIPVDGRSEPQASLEAAAAELERRLSYFEEQAATFNAQRAHHAERWLARNWRRLGKRSGIVRARST